MSPPWRPRLPPLLLADFPSDPHHEAPLRHVAGHVLGRDIGHDDEAAAARLAAKRERQVARIQAAVAEPVPGQSPVRLILERLGQVDVEAEPP